MLLTGCSCPLSSVVAERDRRNPDIVKYRCVGCGATGERHVPVSDYLTHRQHVARVDAALAR